MAAGSHIAVTPGSGAFISTGPTYTESSTTVQDQKVILGEHYLPSYVLSATGISVATSAAHVLQIMAGSTNNVRVSRIEIAQEAISTGTVGVVLIGLVRLSSAGTGGSSITPGKMDTTDNASGATAMTLPSVKGTEVAMGGWGWDIPIILTAPITTSPRIWEAGRTRKPIIIPAGTANGIAFKVSGQIGTLTSATITVTVEFTETSF